LLERRALNKSRDGGAIFYLLLRGKWRYVHRPSVMKGEGLELGYLPMKKSQQKGEITPPTIMK